MTADSQAALLILPGGYGDGPEQRARAQAAGLMVVGASSVRDDPAAGLYETWTYLPHISDTGFAEALRGALAVHGVGHVHASHYAVWHHLSKALPDIAPGVRLTLGRSNFDIEAQYRGLRRMVAERVDIPQLQTASAPAAPLSPVEAAGFLRAAMAIPGESYEAKLLAMMEVARRTPRGDLVEVGCLFGRTAALLAMLARRYDLGSLLCVDPWTINDQGSSALLEASTAYDWDEWRRVFEINVAPFAAGRLNYIHAPSVDGAEVYGARRDIDSEAFGRTRFEGAIGLLHLDGNHAYDHVLADAEAWIPHVKPGGWIVFDDYEWDWGDGPRRVGDAYLRDRAARVRTHFVAGGALFIQLKV